MQVSDLRVCGWNGFGQLGQGHVEFSSSDSFSLSVPEGERVVCAAAGGLHYAGFTVVVCASGKVFGCGSNACGQLALEGTAKHSVRLTQCAPQLTESVARVTCGTQQTFFVTTRGDVFAAGDNTFGQLGIGSSARSSSVATKVQLPYTESTVTVSSGDAHTLFLSANNSLAACGSNMQGQLAQPRNVTEARTPIVLQLAAKDGQVNVADCSAGQSHSIVLSANGRVYCFGSNSHGQLGVVADYVSFEPLLVAGVEEKVKHVSAGSFHSGCVTETGRGFVWGSNEYGQLGCDSDATPISVKPILLVPFQVSWLIAAHLNTFASSVESKGELLGFGCESEGQLSLCNRKIKCENVSASETHIVIQ